MRLFIIVTGLVAVVGAARPPPPVVAVAVDSTSEMIQGSHDDNSTIPQYHNAARHPAADPYVFYDSKSGQYFAYSTEGADNGYLFAVYNSPDLSTWHKQPGGVLRACYDDKMNRIQGGQACWARDWQWAPETYYNDETGWYFFFFAGRLREDMTKDHFRYSKFEEPSKIGVAVSRSPTGPFREIESKPIDWYPYDPHYHDVNLIMDDKQMLPPQTLAQGETAPKGTFIPTIDANVFFDDEDDRIYLYTSRNAYRNWNWDSKLGKYIEESNIIVVELERHWWDDPEASTMPEIIASQIDVNANVGPKLPCNITKYNGTGEIGRPPRKDGWKTVISYGADPQEWENFHVNDYKKFNGSKKDRRWSEGSTLITRSDDNGNPVYLITYSANNFEASNYGVGFATANSPFGPFHKSRQNPVLSQIPDGKTPIYSTGHGSIVASPPRHHDDEVGAQDVTRNTPEGSELFYVHHARNTTTNGRSLYSTRMTLNESAIYVGSDAAINMHLTPLDQALPKHTYPIQLKARCINNMISVGVTSKPGASFDIKEGSNRIVGMPGDVQPTKVVDGEQSGTFEVEFSNNKAIGQLAYQRLNANGTWSTTAHSNVECN